MLKSGGLTSCFAAAAFVAFVFWPSAGLTQDGVGTLTGVVTDAAGAPREGAFVQMKNAERRLYFMVITKAQGRYTNTRLPPGEYVVQAIGGENQSAPSISVEVAAGRSSSVDLSLTVARAPALPPAWPGRQPGQRGAAPETASLAPGEGKAIVEAKCLSCHDAQRIVRSRGNQTRWRQVLHSMKLYAQGSTFAQALTDNEDKVVLAYLAANYAPASGGAKAKPDPFRLNGIRTGNEGELWMIDGGPNRRWLSFDPKTERFAVYDLPPTRSGNASGNTMRVHPNNTVWLNSIGANEVIRLDPATKQFTFFEVPAGVKRNRNASPYGMAVGGDGKIWIVENSVDQIARIDPATGKFDEFPLSVKDPVARKLGSDWDGNLWVGLHGAGSLLRVDYKTLQMMEFTPPSEDSGVYLADADMTNRVIWTSLHHVDKLGRLDPATGVWTEFPLMYAETDVRRIEVDPNNPRRVWYSGVLSGRIGYIEMLQ
jgi:streptogramin lyase